MHFYITKGMKAMVIDKEYKVSIFGNYSQINATPENMSFFVERFGGKDFLPSLYPEVVIKDTAPISIQRVSLVSKDNLRSLLIGTNRIDYIVKLSEDKALSDNEIENFNNEALFFFAELLNKFNIVSNRLALNNTCILAPYTKKDTENFIKRFPNPIKIYENSLIDEWGTRLHTTHEEKLNGRCDLVNIITKISKQKFSRIVNQQPEEIYGFVIEGDINTKVEEVPKTYGIAELSDFLNIANGYRKLILTDIEGE